MTPKPCSSFIKIEVGGDNSQPYKSVGQITWDNIPPFSVLTGLNGSGKTQLLELLAYKLTQTRSPQGFDFGGNRVVITGDNFEPADIAYVPSAGAFSGSASTSIAQMQQIKQQLWQQVQPQNVVHNLPMMVKRTRLERLLKVPSLNQLDQEKFLKQLPDDFAFMLEDEDVIVGLGHVFLAYRLQFVQELERRLPEEDILKKLGTAPWDVVNEILQAADFPYRVISPSNLNLLENYQLQLINQQTSKPLNPMDLSSGEKVLLQLALWLFNSQHHNRFPRLLLLDEPDAHLHPSMTRQFMDVIQEVLVNRYKVRVILTTHSPSTVALSPDNAIFEMWQTAPRIRRSPSKSHTIGLLTAGLVTVSAATRYVLVEDETDVNFYGTIREILTDYGPSKDAKALKPAPTLVFLPVSINKGAEKIGGGNTVVTAWTNKFDTAPLDELFRGIIDLDSGNVPSKRIQVVGRYNIENYLLDPFVVFGILLDEGNAPAINGIHISRGDEHRLREISSSELQKIADKMIELIDPDILGQSTAEKMAHKITFTNGKNVQYPSWMIKRNGHQLLPIYQKIFGGPKVISPIKLEKSLSRIRLIPIELAEIMSNLQA